MRIISGKYKGKRLSAPKKLPVRPTTAMAKEGVFNILNNRYYFDELKVLDLFSGTGNISFEFASRGVKSITAVETHPDCVRFINKTAKELHFGIEVLKADVFKFLERKKTTYDTIFADPPYLFGQAQYLKLPDLVFSNNLLEEDGVLIVEHPPQISLDGHPCFQEKRTYGSCVFSFFGT